MRCIIIYLTLAICIVYLDVSLNTQLDLLFFGHPLIRMGIFFTFFFKLANTV